MKRNVEIIWIILLYLMMIVWLSLFVWGSNKGFDITDEGYYMYYFSMFNESKSHINVSSFHILQNFLFPFIKPTIQNLRMERLLLSSLLSFFILFSSIKFIQSQFRIVLSIKDILLLGVLIFSSLSLTYTFGPQTLSYNSFSYILTGFALIFFLYEFSFQIITYRVLLINSVAMGGIISMLFLVKISNAILLYGAVFGVFFANDYLRKLGLKKIVLNFVLRWVMISVSFSCVQFLLWGGVKDFMNYINDYKTSLIFLQTHSYSVLLNRYWESLFYIADLLITKHYILLLVSCILIMISIYKKNHTSFLVSLVFQLYIIYNYNIFIAGGTHTSQQTLFYIVWLISLIVLLFLKKNMLKEHYKRCNIKRLFFCLFLFSYPFIGIIGTNNLLHIQLAFYLTAWFLIFFIFIYGYNKTIFTKLVITIIVAISFYQSYSATFKNSYRLNTSLFDQTEKLQLKNGEHIYVDKEFKKGVTQLKETLFNNGFKDFDYVFTYSELMGLYYILNASCPTNNIAWFSFTEDEVNSRVLGDFFETRKPKNFFL